MLTRPFISGLRSPLQQPPPWRDFSSNLPSVGPGVKRQVFPVERLLNTSSLKSAVIAVLFLPFRCLTP